jgi:hypothetical protein
MKPNALESLGQFAVVWSFALVVCQWRCDKLFEAFWLSVLWMPVQPLLREIARFPLSVGTNGPPKTLILAAGSVLDYEGDAFVNAVRPH